jgi:hypothetical protein
LNFIFLPPLQRLGILYALTTFLNNESSFVNETCVASSSQIMTLNKKSSKFYSISVGNNSMKIKIMKHETFTNKFFANITSLCSEVQHDCKHVVHLCHKKGLVIDIAS